LDLIVANKTSSDALRPTFPKILLKALKNFALLVANEHLNLAETSRYIPKYLAEVAHVIADPETVTHAQSFLYREP